VTFTVNKGAALVNTSAKGTKLLAAPSAVTNNSVVCDSEVVASKAVITYLAPLYAEPAKVSIEVAEPDEIVVVLLLKAP